MDWWPSFLNEPMTAGLAVLALLGAIVAGIRAVSRITKTKADDKVANKAARWMSKAWRVAARIVGAVIRSRR